MMQIARSASRFAFDAPLFPAWTGGIPDDQFGRNQKTAIGGFAGFDLIEKDLHGLAPQEGAFLVELVLQALERAVNGFAFADNNFGHDNYGAVRSVFIFGLKGVENSRTRRLGRVANGVNGVFREKSTPSNPEESTGNGTVPATISRPRPISKDFETTSQSFFSTSNPLKSNARESGLPFPTHRFKVPIPCKLERSRSSVPADTPGRS